MTRERIIIRPQDIFPKGEQRLKIIREYTNDLKCSLVMPNESNTYSLAVEYMKEWFLDGFQDGYFKSIYVNEKSLIDDFRAMTRQELIKRPKPCCTIIPRTDQDYNRENLDLYNYGSGVYCNRARFQDSFFRDIDKKLFLALDFKLKKITFTFRAKVQTLSTAQNMAEHDKIRFRSNGTQGKYVDMDFLIPDQLILAFAEDAGFKIENNSVVNQTEFMSYLNMYSQVPILYKFNTSIGRFQYYMKMPNMYLHISTGPVQIDDGERKGHIMLNYNVEFDAELLMPAPKFFAYYSMDKKEFLKAEDSGRNTYSLYAFPISHIPTTSTKGWPQYLTTHYEDDIDNFKSRKPLVICFDDLMGDLRKVIEVTKAQYLSPSLFIEFKLFNENKEIEIETDWNNLTLSTKVPMNNIKSYLVMYVDRVYLHEQLIKLKNQENERITPYMNAKNIRG